MINILIIHYNTPDITKHLVESINKFTPDSKIFIFDNSDKKPFKHRQDNLVYIDNTKAQLIDFKEAVKENEKAGRRDVTANDRASFKHTLTIEKCMFEYIKESFILLDSDVLLKKDIAPLFDERYMYVGEAGEDVKGRKPRLRPFVAFINTKLCIEKGVHFFDKNRMFGLNRDMKWDTGASFMADAEKYPHKKIKFTDYITHLGSLSWRNNRRVEAKEWITNNMDLWSDEKVIVTMTSWKKRIGNVPHVLDTILKQTKKPDKIVVNLSVEEFKDKEQSLPENVREYFKKHEDIIEVWWIEGENTRQWKKTIPTMLRYPNDCIICIDDDRNYSAKFIETLWKGHVQHPNNPITLNNGYKFKGKYLQHAGHGTLDKLEYYNGFEGVLSSELYKMASSDTFFTLMANNAGHPIIFVKGCPVTMYNEVSPLKNSEKTCSSSSHDVMYEYLLKKGFIDNLKKPVVHKTSVESQRVRPFTRRTTAKYTPTMRRRNIKSHPLA